MSMSFEIRGCSSFTDSCSHGNRLSAHTHNVILVTSAKIAVNLWNEEVLSDWMSTMNLSLASMKCKLFINIAQRMSNLIGPS